MSDSSVPISLNTVHSDCSLHTVFPHGPNGDVAEGGDCTDVTSPYLERQVVKSQSF